MPGSVLVARVTVKNKTPSPNGAAEHLVSPAAVVSAVSLACLCIRELGGKAARASLVHRERWITSEAARSLQETR